MGTHYYVACDTCKQFIDCDKFYLPDPNLPADKPEEFESFEWYGFWGIRALLFLKQHSGHTISWCSEHDPQIESGHCYPQGVCRDDWNGYVAVMPYKKGDWWDKAEHQSNIETQEKWKAEGKDKG